jgi:DNA polymerase I-like protein with 3'-5' exonuclease and polymerase domains
MAVVQLPLFTPESSWKCPKSLPDIPTGVTLAVDTECRDNGLKNDRGPGWATRDGHIAGVSVAFNNESHYIPLRHPDTTNLDIEQTMGWLQDGMDRAETVVFHNSGYDAGWLQTEDVIVDASRCDDTQFMGVMLDENEFTYGLEAMCKREGVPGKDETKLREAAAAFGIDPKADMWKLPAKFVGEYAAQDAAATLGLREALLPRIVEQRLEEAYRLEMDLMPLTLEMRRRGIRVDERAADRAQTMLRSDLSSMLADLGRRTAVRRNLTIDDMNSPKILQQMFDTESVRYPRTPKTNVGSFSAKWMESHEHWLPRAVVQARQLSNMSEKFIGTYLLGSVHLGRIHSEIHQLRDDDGGTRTYRLSYANPPLQQIPTRTEMGRVVRSILIPEPESLWSAHDYSQQEPRLAVHFADLCGIRGSATAVRYYCDDPAADFHQMVSELTGLPRKQAKIINLGLMYGMGVAKLAVSLGLSVEDAREKIEQYMDRMPWVRGLTDFCAARVQQRGFIRLIDGARSRFDLWEPSWRDAAVSRPALPYERALAAYPDRKIKRAGAHKAMNRLVQGSAARQTKVAMRDCFRAGYTPLLQLHDELDFPIWDPKDATIINQIMIDAIPLRIPMKVDNQFGHNWGQASEEMPKGVSPPTFEELMKQGPQMSNSDIVKGRTS